MTDKWEDEARRLVHKWLNTHWESWPYPDELPELEAAVTKAMKAAHEAGRKDGYTKGSDDAWKVNRG